MKGHDSIRGSGPFTVDRPWKAAVFRGRGWIKEDCNHKAGRPQTSITVTVHNKAPSSVACLNIRHRGVSIRTTFTLKGHFPDQGTKGHSQYNSQGMDCGPSTASEVLLIFTTQIGLLCANIKCTIIQEFTIGEY